MALIHHRMTTEQADESFSRHIGIAGKAVMAQRGKKERVADGANARTSYQTHKTLKLGFLAGLCEVLHSSLSRFEIFVSMLDVSEHMPCACRVSPADSFFYGKRFGSTEARATASFEFGNRLCLHVGWLQTEAVPLFCGEAKYAFDNIENLRRSL